MVRSSAAYCGNTLSNASSPIYSGAVQSKLSLTEPTSLRLPRFARKPEGLQRLQGLHGLQGLQGLHPNQIIFCSSVPRLLLMCSVSSKVQVWCGLIRHHEWE